MVEDAVDFPEWSVISIEGTRDELVHFSFCPREITWTANYLCFGNRRTEYHSNGQNHKTYIRGFISLLLHASSVWLYTHRWSQDYSSCLEPACESLTKVDVTRRYRYAHISKGLAFLSMWAYIRAKYVLSPLNWACLYRPICASVLLEMEDDGDVLHSWRSRMQESLSSSVLQEPQPLLRTHSRLIVAATSSNSHAKESRLLFKTPVSIRLLCVLCVLLILCSSNILCQGM